MSEAETGTRCPSCGYDLSASRTGDPVRETRCSECGARIDWSDPGGAASPVDAWCFDDAGVPRERLWGAAWLTTRRALRPWRFWRGRVPLDTFRWGRLGLLLLSWAVITYVLCTLLMLTQFLIYENAQAQAQAPARTWLDSVASAASWPLMFQYAATDWPLVTYLTTPVVLMLMSVGDSREGPRRLARAAAYGLAFPALLLIIFFTFTTAWFLLWFVLKTNWHVYGTTLLVATEVTKWLVVAWTLTWWTSVACLELRLKQWRLYAVVSFIAALLMTGQVYVFWSANQP